MILVIDNYDSFTYNLVQMLPEDVIVKRNDEITIDEILQLNPTHIVLSPGPATPAESGICIDIVQQIKNTPILGVCLGHQAICASVGGNVVSAKELMHGKATYISIKTDNALFAGLPDKVLVGRYHSLIAEDLPDDIEIIGTSSKGEVMAVKFGHIYGVQFHPESILTTHGREIIDNFLGVTL